MQTINSKHGEIKIFAKTLEDAALEQIKAFADSPLGENANIRIMPDAHAGAGCVIGTTMVITDKVCPNIVGVDIGCGVDLAKTNIDFLFHLPKLDEVIRRCIPFGKSVHQKPQTYRDLSRLKCWDKLKSEVKETAIRALGSLGGGNHFIEAYSDGYLSVHSGSRGIGFKVANFYQELAEKQQIKIDFTNVPPQEREEYIKQHKANAVDKALAYLTGEQMEDYLHDMKIMQEFAVANRGRILEIIVTEMGGIIENRITSTHNYIEDTYKKPILRKGAIAAYKDQDLVIPLNMRDGLLLCRGKGNHDWNYSAPHGAGRIYSRRKAKEVLSMDDYKEAMTGIFSTCISDETLDEAPMAYKDWQEIVDCIGETVEIDKRLLPIYNFKASE